MRHQLRKAKLSRNTKQRFALWHGLCRSLVMHGKIVTTYAKAKSIVPFVEKLVSKGKNYDLSAYRSVLSFFRGDEVASKKIFDDYGQKYQERSGGYVKVIKLGRRKGDSAEEACIMFV
jgi:large subunit ribosomal protein L17